VVAHGYFPLISSQSTNTVIPSWPEGHGVNEAHVGLGVVENKTPKLWHCNPWLYSKKNLRT
jgi:hypothetical protein